MNANKSTMVRKALADIIVSGEQDNFDRVEAQSFGSGPSRTVGTIFYIGGDTMAMYTEGKVDSDYLVVIDKKAMGPELTMRKLNDSRKAVYKAIDYVDVPRSYPLQLFAESFDYDPDELSIE